MEENKFSLRDFANYLEICNRQPMVDKDRYSAKILVQHVTGEKKLIRFSLPRNSCKAKDLLKSAGIQFDDETIVQCIENPGADIDFVVMFGFLVHKASFAITPSMGQSLQMDKKKVNESKEPCLPTEETESEAIPQFNEEKIVKNLFGSTNFCKSLNASEKEFGNHSFGSMSEKNGKLLFIHSSFWFQMKDDETSDCTTNDDTHTSEEIGYNYEIQTQLVLKNRSNRNSTKVLIKLESGEEMKIVFPLTRETCTLRNVLDAVDLKFDGNTAIQCMENPGADIDFIVIIGFSVHNACFDLILRGEQCPPIYNVQHDQDNDSQV